VYSLVGTPVGILAGISLLYAPQVGISLLYAPQVVYLTTVGSWVGIPHHCWILGGGISPVNGPRVGYISR